MAESYLKQSCALPEPVRQLLDAICNDHIDHVIQLLDRGTIIKDTSATGYSAVHHAAVSNRSKVLQILIKRGFKCNITDDLGYTALHLAASQGHLDCVTVLLKAACAINSQEHLHGNTAVHEAAWNGFSQTLQELVKHKADVNLLNKTGFSALHLSSQNGHNECSRVLLFAGCDPNYKNSYGDTALHTAARYGHAGVTRILLIAKCRVNEQNQNGDTALHIAAALKLHKISKMLLQAGCYVNIANNQNERACDIAKRKGHVAIANLLYANSSSRPLYESLNEPASCGVVLSHVNIPSDKTNVKNRKWSLFMKKNKSKDVAKLASPPSETVVAACVPATQHLPPQSLLNMESVNLGTTQTVSVDADVILRSFHLHQLQKHRAMKQETSLNTMQLGNNCHLIQGNCIHCISGSGVQYYRDLAGNIKQDPIGCSVTNTSMQHFPLFQHEHYVHQPMSSIASVPAADLIQNHDHLNFLRSRNNAEVLSTPLHPCLHPYEHPVFRTQGQRIHSSPHYHHHQDVAGEVMIHRGRSIHRSKSDETLSTSCSYSHPSACEEHHHNSHRHDISFKKQKPRHPTFTDKFSNKCIQYFMPDNSVNDGRNYIRQHKYRKSQRKSDASHLRKKAEKLTMTSNESGENSVFPTSSGKLIVDEIPSCIDATSNPDSGYGDGKACLESTSISLQKLTLSSRSSFQNEDPGPDGSPENKLMSSTDNDGESVISSAHSGSIGSLYNSL